MIKLLSARTIAVLVASVASYLLLAASASGVLNAAEIKVLSGGAVKPVMSERNTVCVGIGDGASLTGRRRTPQKSKRLSLATASTHLVRENAKVLP